MQHTDFQQVLWNTFVCVSEPLAYSTVKHIHHCSVDISETGEISQDRLPLEEEQITLPKGIHCNVL